MRAAVYPSAMMIHVQDRCSLFSLELVSAGKRGELGNENATTSGDRQGSPTCIVLAALHILFRQSTIFNYEVLPLLSRIAGNLASVTSLKSMGLTIDTYVDVGTYTSNYAANQSMCTFGRVSGDLSPKDMIILTLACFDQRLHSQIC